LREEIDLELELPGTRGVASAARRAIRRVCADRVDAVSLSDAELMTSELATNAHLHSQDPITLRVWLNEDRLLVEVIDQGNGFERTLRHNDFGQVGGRGLEIVDRLSSRWGVHDGSSHVWFELELPGPRLGERPPVAE
jgi:anti-sigma regulatory factor (Ser/Thr protein kinase)